MLNQRRRRWADVVQMLYTCFVFAGELQHVEVLVYGLFVTLFDRPYMVSLFLHRHSLCKYYKHFTLCAEQNDVGCWKECIM